MAGFGFMIEVGSKVIGNKDISSLGLFMIAASAVGLPWYLLVRVNKEIERINKNH